MNDYLILITVFSILKIRIKNTLRQKLHLDVDFAVIYYIMKNNIRY